MGKDLQVGDAAPQFSLSDDKGERVSLTDFASRNLVLYFYPKDDTSGCTREAIDFSTLADEFAAANTAVVGISPDSVKSHAKFKSKHELSVQLASDEAKQTVNDYGVWTQKSMYGRKYMGVERSTFLIDKSGRIAHIWRKVKVPDHAAEVLDRAKA